MDFSIVSVNTKIFKEIFLNESYSLYGKPVSSIAEDIFAFADRDTARR